MSEVNAICDRYNLRVGYVFHAGDGNLHPLVLIPDNQDRALMERVHHAGREMVEVAVSKGGSLSGEHGVGIEKRIYMSLMHNADELAAMVDTSERSIPPPCSIQGKSFPRHNQTIKSQYTQVLPMVRLAIQNYQPASSSHLLLPRRLRRDWSRSLTLDKRSTSVVLPRQRILTVRV